MTGPKRYRPLPLADLVALKLPEREAVVDGLLFAGSVTLFSAREKSGKTMIATDAACAITLGEAFLDRAVRQGPVIVIALEENIREVRDRILERLGARTDHADIPLHVLPANGYTDVVFRLDDAASMAAFAAMVVEYEAVAVFIDTFREAHGLREDVADDMAPLIRPLRQIAHEANCAVVLIHHQNKHGASRGSTAIAAGADQLWSFNRTDQDATRPGADGASGVLTAEGRFGPRVTLPIRLGDGLRWEPDEAIRVPDPPLRDRILAVLRRAPDGLDARAIASTLGETVKLKSVQNEISRLLQESPSPIVAAGSGRRNDPRRFRLAKPPLLPDDEPAPFVPNINPLGWVDREPIPRGGPHASGNGGNKLGKESTGGVDWFPNVPPLGGAGAGTNGAPAPRPVAGSVGAEPNALHDWEEGAG